MTRRVAIQMDPIASINPRGDSTLLLGLEAQRRGYTIYCYTPDKLTYRHGKVTARSHQVTLHQNPEHYYDLGEAIELELDRVDVVLLRQDPPFDMAYITTTHILEQLHPRPLVVNNPASVRNHPEKLFPLLFRQYMPVTLVTADVNDIEHFRNQYKDIVIKPLYGYGGRSILRLKEGDDNFHALMETQFAHSKEPLMVQPFLPEVKTGDRRIILIDGDISGVMGRIPAEHEIRANFRVGGSPAKAELTLKQREICEALGPVLQEKGLVFAGIDVIGDYLTEINLTSPTGMVQMNKLYDIKLESLFWDAVEARL